MALSEQAKANKRRYSLKWQKDTIKSVVIQLNKNKDAELINNLNKIPNKNKFIKELLYKYFEK